MAYRPPFLLSVSLLRAKLACFSILALTFLILINVPVVKLPAGQSSPLPYLLTLVPPLVLSLLDPEIFFKALDFAGTYGGMVVFWSLNLYEFKSIFVIEQCLGLL